MNASKIVLILGLVVAIVAAFADIPYLGLALVILGLVKGVIGVPEADRLFFLVFAVALTTVAGSLGELLWIGSYVTAILGGISAFVNAAAAAVIINIFVEKVTA